MPRLQLTIDQATFAKLKKLARQRRITVSALGRELLREALGPEQDSAWRKKLAADYAAGREDAREILRDMERAQLELME